MKLTEYLNDPSKKKIQIKKLAKKCKITPQTIHNLMNGRDVRLSIAIRIEEQTKGKVTCMDLYDEFIRKSEDTEQVDESEE